MYVYKTECDNIREAERRIKQFATEFRDGKEFYVGDFHFIKDLIDIAATGVNQDCDEFTDRVLSAMLRRQGKCDPLDGIAPDLLEKIKPRQIVPFRPAEREKAEDLNEKDTIIVDACKDYLEMYNPEYDWDRDAGRQQCKIRFSNSTNRHGLRYFLAARAGKVQVWEYFTRLQEMCRENKYLVQAVP